MLYHQLHRLELSFRSIKLHVRSAPGASTIFVTAGAGLCVHASQDWSKLPGQEVADASGEGFLDRIHSDDRAIVRETRAAAARIAAEYSPRSRLMKPDGAYRWGGRHPRVQHGRHVHRLPRLDHRTGGRSSGLEHRLRRRRAVHPAPAASGDDAG